MFFNLVTKIDNTQLIARELIKKSFEESLEFYYSANLNFTLEK